MKTISMIALIFALGASAAFARINETIEEATTRYGQGTQLLGSNRSSFSLVRLATKMVTIKLANPNLWMFKSGDIRIYAAPYLRNDGKTVIGEIAFIIPKPINSDSDALNKMLTGLLDANSEGGKWVSGPNNQFDPQWERPGAKATYKVFGPSLTIISDDYYQSVINKINETEKSSITNAINSLDKF